MGTAAGNRLKENDMAFQVYNSGNKCYVKMHAGRVLDNKKQPFEGIPIKSEIPPETTETAKMPKKEAEILTEPPEVESTEPLTYRKNEKTETVADSEDSEDGFWGFDY